MLPILTLVLQFVMSAIPAVEALYQAYKGSGTEKKGHIMDAATQLIDGYNAMMPTKNQVTPDLKELVLNVSSNMIDGIVAGLNAKGGVPTRIVTGAEAALGIVKTPPKVLTPPAATPAEVEAAAVVAATEAPDTAHGGYGPR